MGMFDMIYVTRGFINYLKITRRASKKVIKELEINHEYQTKSLESLMERYELRYDGLYKEDREYYEVPEEERPYPNDPNPLLRMCGMLGSKHIGWWKIKSTTTIGFYDGKKDFELEMFRGKITRVIELKS